MRFVLGFVTALLILMLGGAVLTHSGLYNVAAVDKHSVPVQWLLHTVMERSVAAQSKDIMVPDNLNREETLRQGAQAYDKLCVACHLKPGKETSLLRKGLNPQPPNLGMARPSEPAEQFWIIKNGIKMTGMPAWGETHADQELWELTAFVQKLPQLSEQQYADLLQPADGAEPGIGDGHDHDHNEMDGLTSSDESPETSSPHSTKAGEKARDGMGTGTAETDDHYADGHTH